ncbi:MAG: hypothetical protein OXL37_09175 [Chloroflexota bacterium]|nr:hypothetical protein [Chloroflexota bacterium]MDE2961757.1 hypothetical protein [Chloroflexota bacterium]
MNVPGVVVLVVLVAVALVNIVDVARLIPVVLVAIALVNIVVMHLGMMFVVVALVNIVDVARLVPVMFVGIALVNIVLLHYHRLRLLTSRSIVSASVPIADTCFMYQYNPYFDTMQGESAREQGLFKVPDGGLSPRTAIPAKAGIQNIPNTTTFWIPASAGMTDQLWKGPMSRWVDVERSVYV